VSVPTWLAIVFLGWMLAVVWVCAILAAAKRAQAPEVPPLAMLDRLVSDVRADLAVEQVLIVVCDDGASPGAVAVAGAGVPGSTLGATIMPQDSVAAAVAGSGRDALAAGHGPLDRRHARANVAASAGAVALAVPRGAIAIARLDPANPVRPADLARLRTLVRRGSLRGSG